MNLQKSILVLVAVFSCAGICFGKYSGGTGEPNDPYIIATAGDMNEIGTHSSDWNKHFLLVADINLADYTGTQFNIIGNFTGVFDGNDHKVRSFTWWGSSGIYEIGLFGSLDSGGQIKNLGLENIDVNVVDENIYWNDYCIGGLVGFNGGGTITNCYATGNIRATGNTEEYAELIVGGLVGQNDGMIIDSYSAANVSGSYNMIAYVGGVAGYNNDEYGTITNCYSMSTVSGTGSSIVVGGLVGKNDGGNINYCYSMSSVSGYDFVGGLVGCNYRGQISNCYAISGVKGRKCVGGLTGDNSYDAITNCYFTGGVSGNENVGGLVGWLAVGTISSCYSTGVVDGNNNAGGLVGKSDLSSTISNCYATGSISGYYYIGGLVGRNYSYGPVSITDCYSISSVSGINYVGGLVGGGSADYVAASFWDVNTSGRTISGGGTPKTTAEMQTETTFTDAGWDFICETEKGTDEVWTINEGVDYPKLVWDAGCFPGGHEAYDEWLAAGKPLCWCCPRQCHGDAGNTAEYIKGKGYYHVHFKDLNVLLTAWNIKEPPDGPGLAWPDPNICADFDHDVEYVESGGYYCRVHYNDLNILLEYWNIKEPPDGPGIDPNCLDCP